MTGSMQLRTDYSPNRTGAIDHEIHVTSIAEPFAESGRRQCEDEATTTSSIADRIERRAAQVKAARPVST